MSKENMKQISQELTPQQTVEKLDEHIVGQRDAKRAVAIALRNRVRRMCLSQDMRDEVTPKNILMIGPTGVGKTEIARRLAHLANAPFIKVEATKFTEVGYVGRDVESIIRDLIDVAFKQAREQALEKVKVTAENTAEERILDALLPPARGAKNGEEDQSQEVALEANDINADAQASESYDSTRQIFRKKLREGDLDDKEISIDVASMPVGVEIMAPPGMEEMTSQLQNMLQNINTDRKKQRKMRVKEAFKIIQEEEAGKLINEDELKIAALQNVEQNGIVFLDEIDKVTPRSGQQGGTDVSREGVQRDLLPLVEGCTVFTKYGMVKTDHILFIASGAFHLSKPSDLIPELQGRLPIRVELNALMVEDFMRILTEPNYSITEQYVALLATEGFDLEFAESGVRRIAEIAWQVNENTENIGARRLHTVVEKLLEDISFHATERKDEKVTIDGAYVDKQLANLAKDHDLSQYIL